MTKRGNRKLENKPLKLLAIATGRYRRHTLALLLVLSVISLFFTSPQRSDAASKSWDFSDSSSNYTFDSSKIEISSQQAQLKATSGWYNSSWGYRRAITIDNTTATTGYTNTFTNYPLEIRLNSSNFTFANALSDGADIRFTDTDGTTLLDHWIEEYNNGGETAVINVEVPAIAANSSKTIYIYYGNSGASTTSSWSNTFVQSITSLSNSTVSVDASKYLAFPGIVKASNGDYLVVYRYGGSHLGTDSRIDMVRSTDEGATWGSPVTIHDSANDDRTNDSIGILSDGTLMVSYFEANSSGDVLGSYYITSDDNGSTWSSPVALPNFAAGGSSWVAAYGRPIELPNGNILIPGYGISGSDTLDKVFIWKSTDGGSSWSNPIVVAGNGTTGNSYGEMCIYAYDNNTILAAFRQVATPDNIYTATSTDGGDTWGSASLQFDGVSPSFLGLTNGAVMLLVGDRSASGASLSKGGRAYVTKDRGTTWSPSFMFFNSSGSGSDADFGYPSAVQKSNGDIYTVYYNDATTTTKPDIERAIFSQSTVDYFTSVYNDIEAGNLNDWTLGTGGQSASTAQKHGGSYSMLLNDTSGSFVSSARKTIYSTAQSVGAVTAWIYPTQTTNGVTMSLLNASNAIRYQVVVKGASQDLQYCNASSSYVNLPTATTVSLNTWTKLTIKFIAGSDTGEVLVNDVSKGAITKCGSSNSGTSIGGVSFGTWGTGTTGDTFYIDDIYTHQYSKYSSPGASPGSASSPFATDNPTINPTAGNAQTFVSASGFAESATKNSGEIKYQISNDAGSTWYWWNPSANSGAGGWASTVSGYTEASTATVVNSNIASFPTGSGLFLFRAYLHSDGSQFVQLDSVTLTYSSNTSPNAPTINNYNIGAWTNDNTPTLNFDLSDDDVGNTVKYQLQIDDSSDFSSPIVDVTEGSGSVTPRSGVTYTPSALSDGSYYWRVKAIDGSGAESSWSTANSGSIAFKIDTVEPTSASISIDAGATYTSDTSVDLTLSATDADSGNYQMILSENSDFSGASYESYATSKTFTITSSEGTKTIYAKFKDNAGNITSAAVSDTIIYDATAPSSPSISINSGAAATSTDSVTLSLSATDTLAGVSQMILSENSDFSGASYESYATSKAFTLSAGEGTKTVYAKFKDAAGNESASASDTIVYDTTAPSSPSISINSGATYATSQSVTLTLSASDGGSGVSQMIISENSDFSGASYESYATSKAFTLSAGDGAKTVYVKFKDAAGNISASASDSITLDSTAASGSISINNGADYTTSTSATLTISASDGGSGVSQMIISENSDFSGASYESYATSKAFTLSSSQGTKTVYIKFKDTAGNVSTTASDSITYDATAPSSPSVSVNGGSQYTNSTSVTLTLAATDAVSGVSQMIISENSDFSGASYESYATSKAFTLSSGSGAKTVYSKFKDAAGNVSASASATITIDTTSPQAVALTINSGATLTSNRIVTLGLTATDALSGVSQMVLSENEDFSGASYISFATTATFELSSGDGVKTLYFRVKDAAGNVSTTLSSSITVDSTAPTGSVVINAGAASTTSRDVTLSLSASDATTSVTQMAIAESSSLQGATYEDFTGTKGLTLSATTGTKTIYVAFKDAAGNTSSPVSDSIVLLGSSVAATTPSPSPTTTVLATATPVASPAVATSIATPQATSTEPIKTVQIKIIDSQGNPLSGARVELHSDPKVAYSDDFGIATFTDVEPGDHKIIVTYNNKSVSRSITLATPSEAEAQRPSANPNTSTITEITAASDGLEITFNFDRALVAKQKTNLAYFIFIACGVAALALGIARHRSKTRKKVVGA